MTYEKRNALAALFVSIERRELSVAKVKGE